MIIESISEAEYVDNWESESALLAANGAYAWMAKHLNVSEGKWILEVGCGAGASTAAIVATGARVVSFEANPNAVNTALNFLKSQGILAESCTLIDLKNCIATSKSSVFIIEEDICNTAIDSNIPIKFFAGICCWLIGAAPPTIGRLIGPQYGVVAGKIGAKAVDGPSMLREKVHQRTYALASQVLTQDGLIVFVDRYEAKWMNDPKMAPELEKYHKNCANGQCVINNFLLDSRLAPQNFGRSKIAVGVGGIFNQSPTVALYLTSFSL